MSKSRLALKYIDPLGEPADLFLLDRTGRAFDAGGGTACSVPAAKLLKCLLGNTLLVASPLLLDPLRQLCVLQLLCTLSCTVLRIGQLLAQALGAGQAAAA